jgi:hypothetical protein
MSCGSATPVGDQLRDLVSFTLFWLKRLPAAPGVRVRPAPRLKLFTASWIGRSRRGAMIWSRQSRSAPSPPPRASSTALRVSGVASPSGDIRPPEWARFEDPRGRPAELPDWPFGNGRPRASLWCFCCFLQRNISHRHLVDSPRTGHRRFSDRHETRTLWRF